MCALWPWPWRYDLGSRSWHILGSWTTIVWSIIQIRQDVRSYSSDTMELIDRVIPTWIWTQNIVYSFWFFCNLQKNNWSISATIQYETRHLLKYHPHPSYPWKVIVWQKKKIMPFVNCDLDLGDMNLSQVNNMIVWYIIQIKHGSEDLWPVQGLSIYMCTVSVWPWRYGLGSRSWHNIGSWTTIVWNMHIQQGSEELRPGHRFWVCVHFDLDLGDMNLGG